MVIKGGMHILSFDVGIVNLAFCEIVFDESETKVLGMGVVDVSGKTCCDTIANIVRELDENFRREKRFDVVVIENQPSLKNPKAKTVQIAIHTWFVATRSCESVVLCAPSQKNKLCCAVFDEISPGNYRDSKKQTVRMSKYLLGEDFFVGKSDDVADAFVQAIYYFLKTTKSVSKEGLNKYVML